MFIAVLKLAKLVANFWVDNQIKIIVVLKLLMWSDQSVLRE